MLSAQTWDFKLKLWNQVCLDLHIWVLNVSQKWKSFGTVVWRGGSTSQQVGPGFETCSWPLCVEFAWSHKYSGFLPQFKEMQLVWLS